METAERLCLAADLDQTVADHIAYVGTLDGASLTGTQAFKESNFTLTSGPHTIAGSSVGPVRAGGVTFDGTRKR